MEAALTAPRSRILTGLGLAFCGYALFASQDAIVKWLVPGYTLPQILFTRSLVIVVFTLAIGRSDAVVQVIRSSNQGSIALRAALILAAWLLYYSAAARMGLAEITTLYFAAPLVAVGLAATLLGERVSGARWAAAATGFVGVVVAAGPSGGFQAGPTSMALAAACCWAASATLVRWIGRSDTTLTQILASNALFTLACALALPWLWRTPDAGSLGLMLGLGVIGGGGQFLLFEAFRYAPASALAPVEYSGLVWAFLYGYAIWADVPGPSTFAGAGLISAGSLALVWSERRQGRATAA